MTDMNPPADAAQAADPAATAEKPPKPRPEPPTGERSKKSRPKRRTGEKRARLNDALRLELQALRAALTQALESFEVRTGGRIADMLRTLEGDDSLDQPPRLLPVAQAQAALDEIADVRITPEKGRLRELRRIQRLVRELRKQIPH